MNPMRVEHGTIVMETLKKFSSSSAALNLWRGLEGNTAELSPEG